MNKKREKGLFVMGPLQRNLFLIILSGTLTACIIIFIVGYYIFNYYLRDTLIDTTEYGLNNLYESVNNDILTAEKLIRYCQSSSEISSFVSDVAVPPAKKLSTYDRLFEEYQGNDVNEFIPRIVIANNTRFLQVCQTTFSTTMRMTESIPMLPDFDTMLNASSYNLCSGFIPEPFTRNNTLVLTLIRPITYKFNSTSVGYVYLEISSKLFTDHLSQYYKKDEHNIYLTICGHTYLYDKNDPNGFIEITPVSDISMTLLDNNTNTARTAVYSIESSAGRYTAISKALSLPDCYIIQTIPQTEFTNQWRFFMHLLLIVIASIVAIYLVLGLASTYYIHIPLAKIKDKIDRTSAGDFSRDTSIEWDHELGTIGKGINDMSESMQQLLDRRLEDEKQKRDLEYQMLQSQINPHFLYNTLNSIKMMALMQGATGISEMTTALASLLRSISKGTSLLVPIKEELSLINDYFIIQNYRYGGLIQFNTEICDPAIAECPILKFTLQPLVENAIFHGLEPKGGTGSISIKLYYSEDNHIYIDVTDNGVGLPPERIQEIMTSSPKGKSDFFKEIGISNVNKRLQYEFGSDCGIVPISEVGKFTTMRVILPAPCNNEQTTNEE